MSTKNQRVAAYLPSHINEQLQVFKTDRSFKSDSQALIAILTEFFGVSQEVAYQSSSENLELQKRVDGLEERITQIKDELLSELRRELLESRSSSIEQAKVEVKSEPISESPKIIEESSELFDTVQPKPEENIIPSNESADELLNDSVSSLPDEIKTERVETQLLPKARVISNFELDEEISFLASDLSKRLKIGQSTISQRKQDSPEKFADWTSGKDPNSIAWFYVSPSSRFSPIGKVPLEVREELIGNQVQGLTTGELAKRLNMDSSTLSHWKSTGKGGKSPDELLKATREKDPDGIGWILLPETSRFKPEADLQNKHVDTVQGDLLSESDSELPDF